MRKNFILMAYAKLKDDDFILLVKNIIAQMSANQFFPHLKSNVDTVKYNFDVFQNSIPTIDMRSRAALANKRAKKEILIKSMDKLAYLIMADAEYDRFKLESTGFEINALPMKRKFPQTPKELAVFITNEPDSILATCKFDKNINIYKVRVSRDQVEWLWGNEDSTSKIVVPDLPRGEILYVQILGQNNLGKSSWSNSVTIRLPLPNEPIPMRANI